MGTEWPPDASDSLSLPAEGYPMSHQPFEDPDLTDEAEQQLRQLLGSLPTLTMPPAVFTRISDAITAEATTRAALLSNDAEPTVESVPLEKRSPTEAESLPSAPDLKTQD